MFNLAAHKEAEVVDVWNSSRAKGGKSPIFLRSFNDWEVEEVERLFHYLYRRKTRLYQDDQLLLKGSKANGFSIKTHVQTVGSSSPYSFPFPVHLKSYCSLKLGFLVHLKSYCSPQVGFFCLVSDLE